ncbi:hypothetical protein, partial [Actinomyces sp. MRS3W]|uniref:VG15 protein n=1 Tax=Actinomyces sp. MRS3W TaxID=2800796 RepID=UPI0028FDBC82
MASRRDLDKYQRAQGEIDRLCRRELRAVWARLAPVIGDDPAAVRDALVEVVQALCVKYGDLASTAAADWYDDLRAKNPGLPPYAAQTTSPVSPAAVEGTVRYAAGELWGDDPAKTRAMVETALARWNRYAGRDTILHNVGRDPAHPAWARVPRGAKTCAWCTMLASRGWAYSSEDAAARSGHDNCDCQIVPDWEAKKHILEGYDPDRLYDQYQVAHQSVLDEGGTADEESVLAAMRELFPTQYTDGNTGKVKGSSADGTLSAQHYRQRRQRLAADLAAMPEAERRGKKLPPSLPPEAPT